MPPTPTPRVDRVILNQDSDCVFHLTREPMAPCHVDNMVDAIADGGADVMLINPNDQRTNYPSKVWQTFWDGYTPGDRTFFGDLPDEVVADREHRIRQMIRLVEQDCNYLRRALRRCRERGMTPGVTVRMNDMHDAGTLSSNVFSRFFREHPECHLRKPAALGGLVCGLNYACEPVRQHVLALIRELVSEYDFDVMDLDFARFPYHLPYDDCGRSAAVMTEFVRSVRSMLADSGRDIRLTMRVGATPASVRELGFDLRAIAAEGLVDAVTFTAFLNTAWQMPVAAFRNTVGPGVALYACLDYFASQRREATGEVFGFDDDLIRGFAAGYLAAGADGVYFFNFMAGGNRVQPNPFDILDRIKDLDALRGEPKTYLVTAGTSCVDMDPPVQLPVSLKPHQGRRLDVLLAAEPESASVRVEVTFDSAGDPGRLRMRLGDVPLGPPASIEPVPDAEGGGRKAVFRAPAAALCDGPSHVDLRCIGYAKDPTIFTIRSVNVHIE